MHMPQVRMTLINYPNWWCPSRGPKPGFIPTYDLLSASKPETNPHGGVDHPPWRGPPSKGPVGGDPPGGDPGDPPGGEGDPPGGDPPGGAHRLLQKNLPDSEPKVALAALLPAQLAPAQLLRPDETRNGRPNPNGGSLSEFMLRLKANWQTGGTVLRRFWCKVPQRWGFHALSSHFMWLST